jgi:hypothetical protein
VLVWLVVNKIVKSDGFSSVDKADEFNRCPTGRPQKPQTQQHLEVKHNSIACPTPGSRRLNSDPFFLVRPSWVPQAQDGMFSNPA